MDKAQKRIYRVKSPLNFGQFKDKADGLPRRLRWYTQEHPIDYTLEVTDEDRRDESFVLLAVSWTIAPMATIEQPGGIETRQILTGKQSLDQPIVDRIETAPAVPLLHSCDFVIFENSPILRAECAARDQ